MRITKYKSRFSARANFEPFPNLETLNISKASIDNLRSLMPEEATMKDNPDLLYTSFNGAVANLVNSNDDGIMTKEALKACQYFKDKPVNYEHMRDYIIGHVIGHGFSSFADSSILTEDDLKGSKDPFNMSFASVVYRVANPYFAEALEEYGDEISASWEIGFDEFYILLGSKRIYEGELITDDAQVKEFSKYLRAYGGNGFTPDGVEVYRIIVGESILPLGIGFTSNPAAAVKGIITASEKPAEPEVITVSSNNEKNNSQIKPPTVKLSKMKINKVEDIQQDVMEQLQASDIREFIHTSLKDACEQYDAKKAELEKEKQELLAAKESADKQVKEAVDKVSALEKEVAELKATAEAQAKQQTFNDRMATLKEEFQLDEQAQKVVAAQIVNLSDEEYKSWKEGFAVLYKKPEPAKTEDEVVTQVESELEQAKANSELPNAGHAGEENKFARFAKAFELGSGVEVKVRK